MHAPASPTVVRTEYRPDIDGLRAIAVLSVLAFHYGAPLPGGFTGVDVFFVISGFLITQQLYADIERGTFSLIAFYDRRIKRIVPALLVVLIASLIAGHILLVPGDYKSLAKSASAAALGFSNFYFMRNTGYFDQTADLMPLLHTWSLGVEEQYYLIGPLLLFGLAPLLSKKKIAAVVSAIVILGFGVSLAWLSSDPKGAFYMAAPRAWELAIGALLVFLPRLPRRLGEASIVAGITLIVVGFFVVSTEVFPGVWALFPCIGAALVIWPRDGDARVATALGGLKSIGVISYSLYLWHWPVWVYFRIYINEATPSLREALTLAVISLALSILSYFFVEKPIRVRKWPPTRPIIAGLTCCALVFSASRFIVRHDGFEGRIGSEFYGRRSLEAMWEWPCSSINNSPRLPGTECYFGKPWSQARTKAILWGDSHAQHMAPIVEAAAKDIDAAFMLYTKCPAIFGGNVNITVQDSPDYVERCRDRRLQAIGLLDGDPSINLVILSSSWVYFPHAIAKGDDQAGLATFKSALEELIRRLQAPGRRFILIGSVPQLSRQMIACPLGLGLPRKPCGATFDDNYSTLATDRVLREINAEFSNVEVAIPKDALCKRGVCDLSINREFLYRDPSHIRRNLTPETRSILAEKFGLPHLLRAK